jgi:hypothetical protein
MESLNNMLTTIARTFDDLSTHNLAYRYIYDALPSQDASKIVQELWGMKMYGPAAKNFLARRLSLFVGPIIFEVGLGAFSGTAAWLWGDISFGTLVNIMGIRVVRGAAIGTAGLIGFAFWGSKGYCVCATAASFIL